MNISSSGYIQQFLLIFLEFYCKNFKFKTEDLYKKLHCKDLCKNAMRFIVVVIINNYFTQISSKQLIVKKQIESVFTTTY